MHLSSELAFTHMSTDARATRSRPPATTVAPARRARWGSTWTLASASTAQGQHPRSSEPAATAPTAALDSTSSACALEQIRTTCTAAPRATCVRQARISRPRATGPARCRLSLPGSVPHARPALLATTGQAATSLALDSRCPRTMTCSACPAPPAPMGTT